MVLTGGTEKWNNTFFKIEHGGNERECRSK